MKTATARSRLLFLGPEGLTDDRCGSLSLNTDDMNLIEAGWRIQIHLVPFVSIPPPLPVMLPSFILVDFVTGIVDNINLIVN